MVKGWSSGFKMNLRLRPFGCIDRKQSPVEQGQTLFTKGIPANGLVHTWNVFLTTHFMPVFATVSGTADIGSWVPEPLQSHRRAATHRQRQGKLLYIYI